PSDLRQRHDGPRPHLRPARGRAERPAEPVQPHRAALVTGESATAGKVSPARPRHGCCCASAGTTFAWTRASTMWNRLIPWGWLVSRLARSRGFPDPLALLARLHRFAQPSEVAEPIELLRAGVAFHARGLLNARAFQHNLDWVWPYWVERQFDPHDPAFVPRAFSITHVNLTHRNWTAIRQPELDSP